MNEYLFIEIADNLVVHMKQFLASKGPRSGDTAIFNLQCKITIDFGDDPSGSDYKLKMEWDE